MRHTETELQKIVRVGLDRIDQAVERVCAKYETRKALRSTRIREWNYEDNCARTSLSVTVDEGASIIDAIIELQTEYCFLHGVYPDQVCVTDRVLDPDPLERELKPLRMVELGNRMKGQPRKIFGMRLHRRFGSGPIRVSVWSEVLPYEHGPLPWPSLPKLRGTGVEAMHRLLACQDLMPGGNGLCVGYDELRRVGAET
ncbi:MAG: hypothetical protein HPY82_05790 [Gammaproteobacteria bacterium]|nr:hypothetical protein [Gammaproteobacteria bacterium]